jgi:hypothetical protein
MRRHGFCLFQEKASTLVNKAGNAAQSAKESVVGVLKYFPSISFSMFFFILYTTVACALEFNDISLPIHDKEWILFVSGEDQSYHDGQSWYCCSICKGISARGIQIFSFNLISCVFFFREFILTTTVACAQEYNEQMCNLIMILVLRLGWSTGDVYGTGSC